ncbi:MAG TPA: hypothetical protein DEH78_18220, partial [Solibacterales bacterium]|nr:hypothetical protein [Bryobacterales bacterium]
AGLGAKAGAAAAQLSAQVGAVPQAYARLIEGETAFRAGRFSEALERFQAAQKLVDTWLGRLALGRAYLALKAYAEASSEFDACLKRAGEATAVFLDEAPTWRYIAPVYFYLGRAQQGLNSPAARDRFREFLALRNWPATKDPLAAEARKLTTSR